MQMWIDEDQTKKKQQQQQQQPQSQLKYWLMLSNF